MVELRLLYKLIYETRAAEPRLLFRVQETGNKQVSRCNITASRITSLIGVAGYKTASPKRAVTGDAG